MEDHDQGGSVNKRQWHIQGFGFEYVSFSFCGHGYLEMTIKDSVRVVSGRISRDVMDELVKQWLHYRQQQLEYANLSDEALISSVRGLKLAEADSVVSQGREAMISFLLERKNDTSHTV